jgi:hypothetical protein
MGNPGGWKFRIGQYRSNLAIATGKFTFWGDKPGIFLGAPSLTRKCKKVSKVNINSN